MCNSGESAYTALLGLSSMETTFLLESLETTYVQSAEHYKIYYYTKHDLLAVHIWSPIKSGLQFSI